MRFTLRDLLWLMVVVGLSLGWYLHYEQLTRPPKLYRDEEIETLTSHSRYIVDSSIDPPGLVVAAGTSMPLSQVFKTLGINPKRLTGFMYRQYNRSVGLSWQLSPSYDLTCFTTDKDDGALAFDDPNRKIYGVIIDKHTNR